MSIIEKLGITPIDDFISGDYNSGECVCSEGDVRDLEIQRDEMLEALIEWLASGERTRDIADVVHAELKFKEIIEKATGKSWESIRELL